MLPHSQLRPTACYRATSDALPAGPLMVPAPGTKDTGTGTAALGAVRLTWKSTAFPPLVGTHHWRFLLERGLSSRRHL